MRRALLVAALVLATASPSAAQTLDAGATHSCAVLTAGVVRCWGEGTSGKLGTGSTETIGDLEHPAVAPAVALPAAATAVSAGNESTCALLATGDVKCWGEGDDGRLGTG